MKSLMLRIVLLLIFLPTIVCHSQTIDKSDYEKLVKNLNSRWDEQNPIVSPDGKVLYFTRANDSLNIGGPRDKGDIWGATLSEEGIWQEPKNLGRPVNDELKNYILGFSPDGNIMFLNKEKRNPGGLVINDGVAFSVLKNGKWSKPVKISVDYMLNRSKHQSGSISADGSVMLLSLQSYASRGEEDIYISTYKDGKWTQPKNLGSDINTPSQEMTPYLSPDKTKLYFSSNGHGGKGGRDIFMAERQGEGWTTWSKPKSLGNEVNSIGVELNYFIDVQNEVAYFSSTQNSDGYGDIRAHDVMVQLEDEKQEVYAELIEKAEEEQKNILISGNVYNQKSNEPMIASIQLGGDEMDLNVNSLEGDGYFEIEVPKNAASVDLTIKSPGFMSVNKLIELEGESVSREYHLTPLEVGATITLNNVYFERGNSTLLDESYVELDQVVDMLKENPDVKIELSGHTDNQGSSKLNLQLSQERVDVVVQYMEKKGIESKRMKGRGYGGTRPVASNASEGTRKKNRRVEILILKN